MERLGELETACQSLPNDARVFQLMGLIERRQGRWDESTRNLERAVELDPRNNDLLSQTALSYHCLRRYADQDAMLKRSLAIEPNNIGLKVSHTEVEFDSKALPSHQLIDELCGKDPGAIQSVADDWLYCALAKRDPAAAASALAALAKTVLA